MTSSGSEWRTAQVRDDDSFFFVILFCYLFSKKGLLATLIMLYATALTLMDTLPRAVQGYRRERQRRNASSRED